jgi:hypothetical protein
MTILTALEHELIEVARRGDLLMCEHNPASDQADTEQSQNRIRASLIRELLLGFHGDLDPRGLRVARAHVIGSFDLSFVHAPVPLILRGCDMDEPVLLTSAHLPGLDLSGSRVVAVYANRLQVDGDLLLMDGFHANGGEGAAAISLAGARIGGQVNFSNALLVNSSGPALNAEALHAEAGLFLGKFRAIGDGDQGAVRLLSARVNGQLSMARAHLTNESGPALLADGLRVQGDLFMKEGFRADGAGNQGAVRLSGSQVEGQLNMTGAQLINRSGPALSADSVQVGGSLLLSEGFRAIGAKDNASVRLVGARVSGQVRMSGAQLSNESGPAIAADTLTAEGGLFMDHGFRAEGVGGAMGTVRLTGSRIGGQLNMSSAYIDNKTGSALSADGLRVDYGMYLDSGFRAVGSGEDGAVRLASAHVSGQFSMVGAQLSNESGPSLLAHGLQIGGDFFMCDGFQAVGFGDEGAISLVSGKVDGRIIMSGAKVENTSGPLIDFDRVLVNAGIHFSADTVCPTGAAGMKPCPHTDRKIDLNEFSYGSIAGCTWQQWLHLIRHHTPFYRPSPYQRLAAAERGAGHDGYARSVLIEQQHDLRARGNVGGHIARLSHALWGALAGYGYRARRSVLVLLVAIFLASLLGVWAGHWVTEPGHHAAERTVASGSPPGTPCSITEQVGLGLDRGLPLAPAGLRARCDLDTASTAGQWFTAGVWILQAVVWALATLALAGYTSLIRKPG